MSFISDLLGEAYKEGMTEDEMSKALEKIISGRDKDSQKLKAAFDKASAELSKYKKDLEARMSEEEKAKAEQDANIKKILDENASMKKQIAVAEHKAKLISLGYSEDLATSTAEAMFSGDMETVFKNQKTMLEEREKAIRAGMLNATPTPPAGTGSTAAITKKQFDAMTTMELMELYQNDPELYTKLQNEK